MIDAAGASPRDPRTARAEPAIVDELPERGLAIFRLRTVVDACRAMSISRAEYSELGGDRRMVEGGPGGVTGASSSFVVARYEAIPPTPYSLPECHGARLPDVTGTANARGLELHPAADLADARRILAELRAAEPPIRRGRAIFAVRAATVACEEMPVFVDVLTELGGSLVIARRRPSQQAELGPYAVVRYETTPPVSHHISPNACFHVPSTVVWETARPLEIYRARDLETARATLASVRRPAR